MNWLESFETKLDYFCRLSRLDKNDNLLWFDLLSKGLIGYVPDEFIWKYRVKPWDWEAIKKDYLIGKFMHKYREENWPYKYMMHEFHSRKYCTCADWLHN